MRLRSLIVITCLATSMIPISVIGGLQGFEFATAFLGLIVAVTFFVSLFIAYFISHPLEKLSKNIDDISKGNLDVQLEKSEIFEINNLTDSLNRVMTSLKLAIHKVGIKKGDIFEETVKEKQEMKSKYETLLKIIDEWVWAVDEKGICKSCSAKMADALGYKPNEMIGKKIFEFMGSKEAKKLKNIFNEMTREKQYHTNKLENSWHHRDGHGVSVLTRFVPVFDDFDIFCGFRGISKDISGHEVTEEIEDSNKRLVDKKKMHVSLNERKNLKDSLRGEKTLDKLTEKEFDYMFIFDKNANIVGCNGNTYGKLGYKKDEILSLNLADFDRFETIEHIKKKINNVKKQGSVNLKTMHRKKDGTSIFVSENIQYLKDNDMFRCIVKEDILL